MLTHFPQAVPEIPGSLGAPPPGTSDESAQESRLFRNELTYEIRSPSAGAQ